MAGIRELKKHLKSIRSIGQLAGAMRTVATAKYSRVNAVRSDFSEYASACREVLARFGAEAAFPGRGEAAPDGERLCIVVMCGDRGLCGSYNSEVLARFSALLTANGGRTSVIACGRVASQYCRDRKIPVENEYLFGDIPSYGDAQQLCARLRDLYRTGAADRIVIVRQQFKNMLVQTPVDEVFLPGAKQRSDDDFRTLYIPDRGSIVTKVICECLDAEIYSCLLECAAGAQAATIMAMRSAYDNSKSSSEELEAKINRIRQSEVTSDVIEISYDRGEDDWQYFSSDD